MAYLTRKLIKRRAIEAEERRKAEIAEKKRIAREKELERLRKIHEERKEKKRQVRTMLTETVDLCFEKEDKRREDAYAKIKKAAATQVNKKVGTKADIPFEPVTIAFKQELFENCYKRIVKRIAAAKKKAKANKDLKSVSKKENPANLSKLGSETIKSKVGGDSSPSRPTLNATPVDKSKAEPVLEPHHLQLIQEGKRVHVVKYDKNPNPKLRRNYKDMVAVEVTVECLQKAHEKKYGVETPDNRSGSK